MVTTLPSLRVTYGAPPGLGLRPPDGLPSDPGQESAAEPVEGAFDMTSEECRVVLRCGLSGVEAGKPDFCGLAGNRRSRPPATEPVGEPVCVAAVLDQASGVQLGVTV